jgi:PAS domain S-box-containing protein
VVARRNAQRSGNDRGATDRCGQGTALRRAREAPPDFCACGTVQTIALKRGFNDGRACGMASLATPACTEASRRRSSFFDHGGHAIRGFPHMVVIPSELARRALDSAPDAMVITDRSGVILFANRRVSALFGYAREEIIGGSIERLIPEPIRSRHAAQAEQSQNGLRAPAAGVQPELLGRREDGSEFPLEISSSSIQGDGQAVIAVIRNMVDRKHVVAAPIVARGDAARANPSNGRSLAAAGHDLRQPVQNLRLGARSEVGTGPAFSLVPPPAAGGRAGPAGADPVQSPAPLAQAIASRVLLVEDDAAVRDSTCLLLRVQGYHVTAVASLAQALREAREHERPDLLVTGYQLSEGDTGPQVIAMLRERFGTAMKAVLITGDTSPAVEELPRDPHLRIANLPVKADDLLVLIGELLAA